MTGYFAASFPGPYFAAAYPIGAPSVPAYKDLLTTLTADLAAKEQTAAALVSATTADHQADSDVASSTVAFAAAVHAAPGSFVVDDTSSPFVLYASSDGQAYTRTTIAGITDAVPAAPSPSPS